MFRWMCGKRLRDKNHQLNRGTLRDRLGIENISTALHTAENRLRWFKHVQRKPDNDWIKGCMKYPKLSGHKFHNCIGRAKMTSMEVINRDLGICKEDVEERVRWKRLNGHVDRGILDG